jgi:predicted RND superfamily exporter protein
MPSVPRHSTIEADLIHVVGRLTMLHWNHRLVVIAAILALILLALGGLGFEEFSTDYNLYW